MSLLTFEEFCNMSEGTAVAKSLVTSGKLTQDQFDELKKIDPSGAKYKFVDYMAQQLLSGTKMSDLSDGIKTIMVAIDKKQIEGDFTKIAFKDLLSKASSAAPTKTDVKKAMWSGSGLEKGKDFNVAYEGKGVTVIHPLNHKASCFFGKNSKWCTTMSNDDQYWKQYTSKGVTFYYVLGDNGDKDAVAVYEDKFECYDKEDKQVKFEDVIEKWGISKSVFKHVERAFIYPPKTKEDVAHNLALLGLM